MLAGSLFETGDLPGAQRALQSVIRLDARRVPAYAMLGRIFISLGRFDAAIQVLRQALQISADSEIAVSLARALLMQGNPEEAISVLRPFLRSQAASEQLLLYGHALMQLRRHEEAAADFKELVHLAPQNVEAKLRLAAALSDAGQLS